jgi:hypothetical protein
MGQEREGRGRREEKMKDKEIINLTSVLRSSVREKLSLQLQEELSKLPLRRTKKVCRRRSRFSFRDKEREISEAVEVVVRQFGSGEPSSSPRGKENSPSE